MRWKSDRLPGLDGPPSEYELEERRKNQELIDRYAREALEAVIKAGSLLRRELSVGPADEIQRRGWVTYEVTGKGYLYRASEKGLRFIAARAPETQP